MKAQFVYENMEFERGLDPKKAMGIGIFGPKSFRSYEKMAEWLYTHLETYLDVKPSMDLIPKEEIYPYFFTEPFMSDVSDFIKYQIGSPISDNKNPLWKINGRKADLEWYVYDHLKKLILLNHTVKENINFERGGDPKKAMGIGMDAVTYRPTEIVWGSTKNIKEYNNDIADYKIKEILSSPSKFVKEDPRMVLLKRWDSKGLTRSLSLRYLRSSSSKYKYIYWEGKYYPIHLPLEESINFERGQDPKSAMGIGVQGIFLEKLNNLLLKDRDDINTIFNIIIYPEGVAITYATLYSSMEISYLRRDLKEMGLDLYLKIYASKNKIEKPTVLGRETFFPFREEYIGIFEKRKLFLSESSVMRIVESLNFERGIDSKEKMGIGRSSFPFDPAKFYNNIKFKNEIDQSFSYDDQYIFYIEGEEFVSDDNFRYGFAIKKNNDNPAKGFLHLWNVSKQFLNTRKVNIKWNDDINDLILKLRDEALQELNESLDFERGIDPKESMEIGMEGRLKAWLRQNYRIVSATDEVALQYAVLGERLDFVKYLIQDKGVEIPVKIMNLAFTNKVDDEIVLILITKGDPERIEYIRSKSKGKYIRESLEFERGQDPKSAMGIGMEERIRRGIKKDWYSDRYRMNLWDGDYNIALGWASEKGYLDIVKWLINAGADPLYNDNEPLKQAAMFGQKEVALYLIDQGADPLAGNGYAILAARFAGHNELWDLLKMKAGERKPLEESLNFERGRDPYKAMGIGQVVNIPKILLKQDLISGYGVDGIPGSIRDIQTTKNRILIRFHHKNRIKNLETNKIISKEKYAKKLAEDAGIWDLFSNFYHAHKIAYEFYYTLKDEYKGMLRQNQYYNYDNMNESLEFERGIDPYKAMSIGKEATFRKIKEMMLKDGWTPPDDDLENMLGWAVEYRHVDLVKFLLDNGAPNRMAEDVELLSWAVMNNDVEMVKLLLKYGADPYLSGKYALRISITKGYNDIIELLESYFNPEDIEYIKGVRK